MMSLRGSWRAQEKGRLVLLARPQTTTGLHEKRRILQGGSSANTELVL